MTTPEKRPTPAEILEMVQEYGHSCQANGYTTSAGGVDPDSERWMEEGLAKIAAALALYDWRPIADAPKDGTPMLLHGKPEPLGMFDPVSVTGRWDGLPEWCGNYWKTHGGYYLNATHFQPLPAPPKEGRHAADKG